MTTEPTLQTERVSNAGPLVLPEVVVIDADQSVPFAEATVIDLKAGEAHASAVVDAALADPAELALGLDHINGFISEYNDAARLASVFVPTMVRGGYTAAGEAVADMDRVEERQPLTLPDIITIDLDDEGAPTIMRTVNADANDLRTAAELEPSIATACEVLASVIDATDAINGGEAYAALERGEAS